MDFDLSKENIQPLRGGRNVSQLEVALQAQTDTESQGELLRQKESFEEAIRSYEGDDPLDNWYSFISWVEQSYPKHGHEGNLVVLLEDCLKKFEQDERYVHDRRLCKLWIKYIDLQQNPLELFQLLHSQGICTNCSDLYRAWAYYHEVAGDFKRADMVFQIGLRNLAQPYEDLVLAHENMFLAAGKQIVQGVDEGRLLEQRQALTSLRTYKHQQRVVVGSARIGGQVLSATPGSMPLGGAARPARSNCRVAVFEDEAAAGPSVAGAGRVSVLDVARRQEKVHKENALKPGPWTGAAAVAARRGAGAASHSRAPAFKVHEDDEEGPPPLPDKIMLPAGFAPLNHDDFSDWHTELFCPGPSDESKLPMYPKAQVYSDGTEYSLEELRARSWLAARQRAAAHAASETQRAVQSILPAPGPPPAAAAAAAITDTSYPHLSQLFSGGSSPASVLHHHSGAGVLGPQPPAATDPSHHHLSQLFSDSSPATPAAHSRIDGGELGCQHSPERTPPAEPRADEDNYSLYMREAMKDVNDLWKDNPSSMQESRVELPLVKTSVPCFQIFEDTAVTREEPKRDSTKVPLRFTPFQELEIERGRPSDFQFAIYKNDSPGRPEPAAGPLRQALHDKPRPSHASQPLPEAPCTPPNPLSHSQPAPDCFRRPSVVRRSEPALECSPTQDGMHNCSCNTQIFSMDLNAHSTPSHDKLSVILETTECRYTSSSSSSGPAGKSSVLFTRESPKTIPEASGYGDEPEPAADRFSVHDGESNDSMKYQWSGSPAKPARMEVDAEVELLSQDPKMDTDSCPDAAEPFDETILQKTPSDPFSTKLTAALLRKVGFPNAKHLHNYLAVPSIPRIVRKETLCLGDDRYLIDRVLGKGTYGSVFRAVRLGSNEAVALKFQKPGNNWEYYISKEIQDRLRNPHLLKAFLDVSVAYFSRTSSLLVTEFCRYGSLLDVRNKVREKTGKGMKELVAIYFANEIVTIINALHGCQIIHADVKPDNFLVMRMPPEFGHMSLKLIDFGCSIDMTLFPRGTAFTKVVSTEDFVCSEMKEGRPWTYQTDLYCLAATVHVLLLDRYMRVQKRGAVWALRERIPRYMRTDLWNTFFFQLLNIEGCDRLPDLALLRASFDSILSSCSEELQVDMRLVANSIHGR